MKATTEQMKNTEKKYWSNGYSKRGLLYQYAFSYKNIGILISIRLRRKLYFGIESYKLA